MENLILTHPDLKIRKMTIQDLKEVIAIETQSFEIPWTSNMFVKEINNDIAKFYVAHRGETIVGYIGFWDIDFDIHLLTLAVQKEYRKRGIGSYLIEFVIAYAKEHLSKKIFLEVSVENIPAINLYKKYGFVETNVRKKYYQDISALLMEKEL